ncbi:hypothetical protein [Streptomyces sp. NPDC054995]
MNAPVGALLTPVRLGEQATGQEAVWQGTTAGAWPLGPFVTLTLRIEDRD